MQNNTHFPYKVQVFFNKARTPKKFYPFKTLRAAGKFYVGLSTNPLFVAGTVWRQDDGGDLINVTDEAEAAYANRNS